MEHLLLQLIREAKQANPESEAVRVFEYLTDRMSVDIEATIKDIECNHRNNVYENDSDAQAIIEVREALEKGNVLAARKLGLGDNARLDAGLNSKLAIFFTNYDEYIIPKVEDFSLSIPYDDIAFNEFDERNVVQVVEDCLESIVTGDDIGYLGDQKVELDNVYVDAEEMEQVLTIEITAYKFEIKAAIENALNKKIFTLPDGWSESL